MFLCPWPHSRVEYFEDLRDFIHHFISAHQNPVNMCEFCGKILKYWPNRIRHLLKHMLRVETGNICPVCSARYEGKEELNFHFKGSHLEGLLLLQMF